MSQRFFSETPLQGQRVQLHGPEAKHLASVMRAEVGDQVVLFDGTGVECEASVMRIGKRDVELRIESRQAIDREASTQLTLAVAMPKAERQKWLVEKAVELGVAKIVPIITQRSIVKLKESGLERLRRTVIEASKQCGRNRLLEIASPVDWKDYLRDGSADALRLVAHPGDETGGRDLEVPTEDRAGRETCSTGGVIAAIGPEGGFTETELEMAIDAGWQAIALGPRILRVETAALKLAASLLID